MNQNKALELTKDIATDIIGGILIAVGVYNLLPPQISDGRGKRNRLIFYQLFGLPIGTVALILNIPIAILLFSASGTQIFPEFSPDDHYYFHNHGRDRTAVPGLSG